METSFKRQLFGGEIEFILYDTESKNSEKIIDSVYMEALRLQKIFNVFDEDSEISKLNREMSMKVSPELKKVLKKALEYSKITNGKYDVSLGKSISQRKTGKKAEIKSSYKDVKMFLNKVSLKNEAMLDLGSIAKGYITDKLAELLRKKGIKEFLIDSRGDIVFSGNFFHVIQIQHPRNKDKSICSIKVRNEAVATSGDYNQFYGNLDSTHILNRNEEIISVTVVAKTLEEADLLATALFVSNQKEINEILKKNRDAKAMIINKDLGINYYNNFQNMIT